MTDWPSSRVRQTFIDFFCKKKGHTFIPSGSVIPENDPTLLFTNAGMNQFKPIFLGLAKKDSKMGKLKRVANSQKCIRAGGKHNDLEDVGKDVYHHTFFEMLGNWSFGDYFKKEAIDWAWELLTEVYGLEKERLYASYFGGNKKENIPEDTEAKEFWSQYLPIERILPFGKKENFWEMGDTGPCGGCSEIHYDRIGNRDASKLVNEDDPDVLEIWNLVFIEYNREPSGKLVKLPKQHVDTGLGFERLTSILQNKRSNYDTDCFVPIFNEIQRLSECRPYTGLLGDDDKDGIDTAYRVVGDHIRTLTIALTDGGKIGKKGRNYVIKRISRRASRFRKDYFKANPGFLSDLVDVVVQTLGHQFPEVRKNQEKIKSMIRSEEMLFDKKLDHGKKVLNQKISELKNTKIIPGEICFLLYQSYGFPIDLTEIMASKQGFELDMEGYKAAQKKHEDDSRGKKKREKPEAKLNVMLISQLRKGVVPGTKDMDKFNMDESKFTVSKVLSIVTCPIQEEEEEEEKEEVEEEQEGEGEDELIPEIVKEFEISEENGEFCGIILDKTSFYREQGGQVNDTGSMILVTEEEGGGEGVEFEVLNVQGYSDYIVHTGRVKSGVLRVGQTMKLVPDLGRRRLIGGNHTCTHLLNLSLRKCFGGSQDVEQQGSHVDETRLRFDFNWEGKALKPKQLRRVEDEVNKMIAKDYPVYDREVRYEKAVDFYGLRRMGDKYPELVRVVSIGPSTLDEVEGDPKNKKWLEMSMELCGGTHLKSTGDVRGFVIYKETSSSKGVRRILGVTGPKYVESHGKGEYFMRQMESIRSSGGGDGMPDFLRKKKAVMEEMGRYPYLSLVLRKKLEAEFKSMYKKRQSALEEEKMKGVEIEMSRRLEEVKKGGGEKFVVFKIDVTLNGMKVLTKFHGLLEKKLGEQMVPLLALGVNRENKEVSVLVTVPKSMVKSKGLSSKECFDTCVSKDLQARGGGRPVRVQGKGRNVEGVEKVVELASKYFASKKE